MTWVDRALQPYPGDRLLSRTLWRPLQDATEADIWSYYTSRPRRYGLEPTLKSVSEYRYPCRCRGRPGSCDHVGEHLELRCHLASRTRPSERLVCWLRAEDALLNPSHAAVIAQYAPFVRAAGVQPTRRASAAERKRPRAE